MPSRLQAPNGAIFRFLEAVEIPPRSTEGPGRQSVQVVADEYDEEKKPIGDRGNIDAGTELFFPALRPESRELWYAKANLGPLVGGSTLTHYFLQDNEFERVQEVLIETLRVRAVDQLRAEIANRSLREKKKYVLLDDPRLLKAELLQADFPAGLIGQELQTFQVPGRIKVSGIVFDQQEVVHFLTEKLRQRQDNRKKLLHLDQQSTEYEVLELEPLDIGKWLKLSVEMQGIETLDMESDALSAIEWRDNLRREIAGKKLSEAQSILTNFADIERVLNLEISPFWADQLPKLHDRIHFEIQN